MALQRMIWPFAISLLLASTASAQHQIVCSGEAAGGYAAFPDVCRLRNGDLYCVFYSGYGHVSTPNAKWPRGGRVMAVREQQYKLIIDFDRGTDELFDLSADPKEQSPLPGDSAKSPRARLLRYARQRLQRPLHSEHSPLRLAGRLRDLRLELAQFTN